MVGNKNEQHHTGPATAIKHTTFGDIPQFAFPPQISVASIVFVGW